MFTTSGTLKVCPNLKETALLAFIVTGSDFNGGRLFYNFYNVSQCFHDISNRSHFSYICVKVFMAVSGEEKICINYTMTAYILYIDSSKLCVNF